MATVLPVDLSFPTGQITHWVFSFLPCLQALIETTSLQAKISLARGSYSFNPPRDYSCPCSAYPASQWRFSLGKCTFQDWWVLMRL